MGLGHTSGRSRLTGLGALASGLALLAATAAPAGATTNDPLRDQQWGLDQIHAEEAWSTSSGAGAVVAVLDTGVDLTHPDLQANLVGGATFIECNPSCGNGDWKGPDGKGQDIDSHGTHVAGIVAAVTDNGEGVAGTAPDAKVMPVKVLEDGAGSFEDIANGIYWAVDNGADVINLSLGALPGVQVFTITGLISDVTEAIAHADSQGVLVVAAAGNEAFPVCDSPSFDPGALCVTATDPNELSPWYSNGALKEDMFAVAAPGGAGTLFCADDVVSTVPAGTEGFCGEDTPGYDFYAGTSMATPQAAGVAALLYAQNRSYDNIREVFVETSRTPLLGTGVYTTEYGWGIVDAAAAVAYPGAGEGGGGAGGETGGSGGETGNKGGKAKGKGKGKKK